MNRKNIRGDKVSPFPTSSKEDFSLFDEWYLPQDLDLLREVTGNPNLEWDFSSRKAEEIPLYRRIYSRPWVGSLELLFFREPGDTFVDFFPTIFHEDRVRGLIKEEDERAAWISYAMKAREAQLFIIEKEDERRKRLNVKFDATNSRPERNINSVSSLDS